jgi:hypothetical protein
MPHTQARGVPFRGSKVENDVIAAAKVSVVKSARVCGSACPLARFPAAPA